MKLRRSQGLYISALCALVLLLIVLYPTYDHETNVLKTRQLADVTEPDWSFCSVDATLEVFHSNSSGPSGENLSMMNLSARFHNRTSEVRAMYRLGEPVDLTGFEEIISWLYADSSSGADTGGFSVADRASFSYGIYLYDSSGNYKGLDHIPIRWLGLNEIVFPTSFEPNDVSPGWNDSTSFSKLTAIRLDFQTEEIVDNDTHNLSFGAFSALKVDRSIVTDWLGLIVSFSLILLLFVSPILLTRSELHERRWPLLSSLPQVFQPLTSKIGVFAFSTGVVVRILLILITPMSSDFVNVAYGFGPAFTFANVFSTSIAGGGIWITVMHLLYRVWLGAPVDHPTILQMFPGHVTYPSSTTPVFYFLSTPGSTLFLLVTKSVLLFFDLGIGFLIYSFVSRISGNNRIGLISFAVWLLNPLSILTGVVWGGLDLILSFFFLLSVYLLESNKILSAAVAYGVSIATKLFPIVLLPVMIFLVRRREKTPDQSLPSLLRNGEIGFILISSLICGLLALPNLVLGGSGSPLPDLGRTPDFAFFYGPIFDVFWFKIGLTPVLYVLFLFVLFNSARSKCLRTVDAIVAAILVLFAFSRWNPQFIIWLLPFLIISAYLRKREKYLFLFVALTLSIDLCYFGPYFATWGHSFFFYPVTSPTLQSLSDSLRSVSSNPTFVLLRLDVFLGSSFAGFCLGYLYLLMRDQFPDLANM